jgi:hypothetical protein
VFRFHQAGSLLPKPPVPRPSLLQYLAESPRRVRRRRLAKPQLFQRVLTRPLRAVLDQARLPPRLRLCHRTHQLFRHLSIRLVPHQLYRRPSIRPVPQRALPVPRRSLLPLSRLSRLLLPLPRRKPLSLHRSLVCSHLSWRRRHLLRHPMHPQLHQMDNRYQTRTAMVLVLQRFLSPWIGCPRQL